MIVAFALWLLAFCGATRFELSNSFNRRSKPQVIWSSESGLDSYENQSIDAVNWIQVGVGLQKRTFVCRASRTQCRFAGNSCNTVLTGFDVESHWTVNDARRHKSCRCSVSKQVID